MAEIPTPSAATSNGVDGATQRLVDDVYAVAAEARKRGDGRIAVLGHSMASDIVVRLAQGDFSVVATVAVSMFSPAITAASPRNLLVRAGADKNSPEAAARASARQAESAVRAERAAAADLEKKDKAQKIKLQVDAAAAASRAAEDAELKRAGEAAEAQSILDEASRTAKRDARYANRMARS